MDRQDLPPADVLQRQLVSLFAPVSGVVVVRERVPNPYASRLASETVLIETPDGAAHHVFCKHGARKGLDVHGRPSGVEYEWAVYRDVLEGLGLGTPRLFGLAADPVTSRTVLALEPLVGFARVHKSGDRGALVQAAAWIGRFHARTARLRPAGVNQYDDDYYRGWILRAEHAMPRVAALGAAVLARIGEVLKAADHVVAHGEYYPDNVLVRGGAVKPVDWEWTALAAGEIDLAALTEGWWPTEQVAACCTAYCEARWPEGAPASFAATLEAARGYLHLRALGGGRRLDEGMAAWRCSELERIVRHLERVAATS